MKPRVLFLCPHGAAKSVIAAAYCQRLAGQYGLDLHISFAGTEPDEALSPAVIIRLEAEGLDVPRQGPRPVTQQDLEQANWIISLGCDIEELAPSGKKVEHWTDVPSPSQDIVGACQSIQNHIAKFMENLSRVQ